MKFIGYKCEFNGKINEIHILINEKSNREIPGFFKIWPFPNPASYHGIYPGPKLNRDPGN